jgi:glycosyltransferase involved in cell wall biosynthesis
VRYWLLTTEYPPFYGGGISTYCEQTVRMLSAAGHEVTVFVPFYDDGTTQVVWQGKIRIVKFCPSSSPTVKFLGHEANLSFAFSEAVIELILQEGKPDILESQEYLGIAYYLLQKKHLGYKELIDMKVILTLHAPTFLYLDYNQVPIFKHPNFWTGEMERFCIRAADFCISPSAYLPKAIESRLDLSGIDIHVLPNPFESDYLKQEVPPYTPNEVIFYGKVIPQKGCIELLKYFGELWEEGFTTPLRMIGGGTHLFHPLNSDLITHLRQKYKKYHDKGLFIIEGQIKPEQLFRELSNAHVILIPSIVDNLPYTVMEAMGAGKIVLASKQGGQSEIIEEGKDGFLFDHEEAFSFHKTLKKILAMKPAEVMAMGQAAKEKIKRSYSHAAVYKQKIAILTQSMQGNSSEFPMIRPPATVNVVPFVAGEKLLSVVVPYFNMGLFLSETIQSIKASDYKNIEIVIVDDGSTDEASKAILDTYSKDPKIRIIRKKNEGLALARNEGALASRGEFLAFLDPDDTIQPAYYSKAMALLQTKANLSFIGCWAQYFGESNDIWPAFNPEPPYILLHNSINTSALIYKKSHFLDAGLNDPKMIYGMEDYDSLLGMLAKGYRGAALPEALWNYRIRKDSMAQAFTTNSKLYLYKRISDKHHSFYSEYASDLFMLLNTNGPSLNIDNPTLNRGIYSKFALSRVVQKAIALVKKNKILRPVLLRIYKRLVK